MTNPLIAHFATIANKIPTTTEYTAIRAAEQIAYKSNNPTAQRLAKIALKTLLEHGHTQDVDETEIAARYTNDPFEARLIALACHWSNDLIDACFYALDIGQPEGASFNGPDAPNHDSWYRWFVSTVEALTI